MPSLPERLAAVFTSFHPDDPASYEDVSIVGDEPHFMVGWTMVFRARVGGEMRAPGVSELRTEGGKVVLHRDYWDLLGTLMSSSPMLEPLYKRITALLG